MQHEPICTISAQSGLTGFRKYSRLGLSEVGKENCTSGESEGFARTCCRHHSPGKTDLKMSICKGTGLGILFERKGKAEELYVAKRDE